MNFFVYILVCSDNTYYTGCTNNLKKRIKQHNTSKIGARYTKMRRPVVLQYFEKFTTLSAARKREAAIKRLTHSQKENLFFAILKKHGYLFSNYSYFDKPGS